MRVLLIFTTIMFACSSVFAGPLPRPSVRLKQADVVFLHAELGLVSDGKLQLTPLEVLHNETAARSAKPADLSPIAIRVPAWMAGQFTPGQRVLLGYQALVRDRSNPDKSFKANPNGPAILSDLGLEPAVLPDRPELRSWFARKQLNAPFNAAERSQLLAWLGDADPQVRQFAVAELTLGGQADNAPATRTALLAFLADPNAPAAARALVLETAERGTTDYPRAQLYKVASELLAQLPTEFRLDGRSEGALIAQMAFDIVHGQKQVPARERWLRSNVAPLAEVAYLQLKQHTPERAEQVLRQTLASSFLAPNTRELLLGYVKTVNSR